MQIQRMSFNQNEHSKTNFKSVYPVYHWHKPADVYIPAEDMTDVKRYQRRLTSMLNSIVAGGKHHKPTTFLQDVIRYISEFDPDYKKCHYVRSFFNYNGGRETAWNGNVYAIEPMVYILTGKEAVDFDASYCRPIEYAYNIVKQYDCKKLKEFEISEAKKSYGYGGAAYINMQKGKFKSELTGNPLELHTVFKKTSEKAVPKLVKLGFFETGGKDNPLVVNEII